MTSSGVASMPSNKMEEELNSGAWFGEACLFVEHCIREFTVFAVSDSELAVFASRDYHRLIMSHPDVLSHHRIVKKAVEDNKVDLAGLAFRAQEFYDTRGPNGTSKTK